MTSQKPKKTPYENQEEIFSFVMKKLKQDYLKNFSRAYLTGSLTTNTFGVYEKEFEGYLGSDIDLTGIPNKKIPKNWEHKGIFHDWYNEYEIGKIKIKETTHPINLIIPLKNDLKLLLSKGKELNRKIIRIK